MDHIATFRKMHIFEMPGERLIVLLTAGNLATTQSVISLLEQRSRTELHNLLNVHTMYDAALLVSETIREVITRDGRDEAITHGIDLTGSFIMGGQIRGEKTAPVQYLSAGQLY